MATTEYFRTNITFGDNKYNLNSDVELMSISIVNLCVVSWGDEFDSYRTVLKEKVTILKVFKIYH